MIFLCGWQFLCPFNSFFPPLAKLCAIYSATRVFSEVPETGRFSHRIWSCPLCLFSFSNFPFPLCLWLCLSQAKKKWFSMRTSALLGPILAVSLQTEFLSPGSSPRVDPVHILALFQNLLLLTPGSLKRIGFGSLSRVYSCYIMQEGQVSGQFINYIKLNRLIPYDPAVILWYLPS